MISAIILTKNEEKNIERCLQSLSFCDEIIAIDDYSTDKTLDILKKNNVKVIQRKLDSDFSKQRNFGMEKAKNEWVLFVDADEVISEELQKEILKKVQEEKADGFYMPRQDFLFGKKLQHGDAGNVSLLRLGKKSKGKWKYQIHEVWEMDGKTLKLKSPIQHFPHQTISEFLREIDFYSTIRARELWDIGIRADAISIIMYPKLKFLHLYFLKLGILDGISGLVHAIMMSFYTFLVRSKLYLHKK